jgi:hypothetical protein
LPQELPGIARATKIEETPAECKNGARLAIPPRKKPAFCDRAAGQTSFRRIERRTRSTMPMKKDNLDKQLERAQVDLAGRKKVLDAKGVKSEERRRDPEWRRLSALCASIKSRLNVVQASKNLDEELKQRKVDKAAAKAAEAAAPKGEKKGKKEQKEQKPPKEKKKKEKAAEPAEAE